jgi:hypothetical protein
MDVEVVSTNRAVKAVIDGSAPRAARMAAARGALPLPQADQLEVLVHLAETDDQELAATAKETLDGQDTSTMEGLFRSDIVAPKVLAHFTTAALPRTVHEAVLSNANTPAAVIAEFARTTASGELLEFLALNQQLLIRSPAIIDAIIQNPKRTAEAGRRAAETKREFFEKERGAAQIASELRAQGNEAAAEFIEQAEFSKGIGGASMSAEDAIFLASHIEVTDGETDDSWLALEYLEDIYEETEAEREAIVNKILGEWNAEDEDVPSERVSMLNRIMKMGVKDRVKMAMRGDREARNILIRDPNRLVSQAVATNPRITEKEVEMIASMRSVPEDVLRQIAINRQWTRCYPIMHNLVRNPRTPLANSMTVMNRLQLRDLVALSKNRNVPDAVRRHALRLTQARSGKP